MDDADLCISIPLVHGADGFFELCAARFVDTTGVRPCVGTAVHARLVAEVKEFEQAGAVDGTGVVCPSLVMRE